MRKHLPTLVVILLVALGFFAVGRLSAASGTLEPTYPPNLTLSYTLNDIYNRLVSGAAGSQITFTEPITGPTVGTMHTLNDIMSVAPALDNAHGATSTQVLTGTTAWGLTGSQWGPITGTMPNNGARVITLSTVTQTIAAGYYNGAGQVVLGEPNLLPGNIRSGVTLFGIVGKCKRLPATGQTTSYAAGDDGAYQLGCLPVVPLTDGQHGGGYNRGSLPWHPDSGTGFKDNGDGTVTDYLTGLIWLKDASCVGLTAWTDAFTQIGNLNGGTEFKCADYVAGSFGDWRLPNQNELRSLIDPNVDSPAVPAGSPFVFVNGAGYWSGSTVVSQPTLAWIVDLFLGYVGTGTQKTDQNWVWPVRGGQ